MITETTTPPPPGDQHDRSSSDHRVPEAAPVTLVPLIEPSGGVPHVVETERELLEAAKAIAAGRGRSRSTPNAPPATATGSAPTSSRCVARVPGTWLIDPIACPTSVPSTEAIGSAEWILHAATQDLACLAEVGLRPQQLFDTELAARILGLPRVGLAAVVEHYLGLAWPRSTPPSTGRPGRCPSRGCATPPSTSRCSTSYATSWASTSPRRARPSGRARSSTRCCQWAPTERVDPWRRTSGMQHAPFTAVRGHRPRALVRPRRHRQGAGHLDRPGRSPTPRSSRSPRPCPPPPPTCRAGTAPSPATAGSGSPRCDEPWT
jgi:ribonuclease D